ncbi:uncharacterized protein LOC121730568 isoform X1 [Aricia agestis]|uniref:uncharacterized protein LOC121730568 isoform X1 n=2 Tax=Aricia agestis TaxID=91739 RepID=UPI001C20C259|nr:uncharacterized protein LOC121730568 isoform X1 [Aricia agestis]
MHVEFNKFITAILTIFKLHQTAIMGEGIIIFALWYAFLGYMYYREEEYFCTKNNQNDQIAKENQIRTQEKKEAKTEETDGTKQEINKTVLDVEEIKQDINVDVAKTVETILDTDTTDSESEKADGIIHFS